VQVSPDGTQFQLNGTITLPSGVPQKLAFVSKPNPDCSQGEIPVVRAVTEPAHGKLQIVQAEDFPTFRPASNPLAKCNTVRIKGIRITYTPDAGYVGKDEYEFEAFGNGRVVRSHAVVNVL